MAGGDLRAGVGVLRREPADRDEDRWSKAVPNAVVLVGESIREPMVVVGTEKQAKETRESLLIVG